MVADYHTRRLKGEKLPEHYAFRIIHKNGSIIWAEINAVLIQWNEKPAALCFMTNVTERKQAEESLWEREDFLSTILDTTADGFWVIDSNGVITDVNEAYCSLSGYTREEILGLHINDIDADETPAQTQEMRNLHLKILNKQKRNMRIFQKLIVWKPIIWLMVRLKYFCWK